MRKISETLRGWHTVISPTRAALALAPVILLSVGCQVFAPSAIGSLAASREEKRVLQAAEADPFPSPADVGLSEADGDQ